MAKKTRHPGVTRLKDGRWRIRATAVRSDGSRKDVERTLPEETSERAAVMARQLLVDQLQTAAPSTSTATPACSLSDYAVRWLEVKAARLKPSVAEHYSDVLAKRILPLLGGLATTEITRHEVERWVGWAEAQRKADGQPYAQETLRAWWRPLGTLLRDVAADAGIADPMRRVRPPRSDVRGVRERRTMTGDQLGLLLEQVSKLYPQWRAEIQVACLTGMRAGELHALRWQDVDREAGSIHVVQAVWRQEVGAVKTDDPRDVALTELLARVLDEHRKSMIAAQHPGLRAGLVFPASTGTFRGPSATNKVLRLCGKAAGIPFKVSCQVLRRSFNTLSLERGGDHLVLRSQMGHTTEAMTSRYAGIHVEAKRRLVEGVEQAVGLDSEANAAVDDEAADARRTDT